MAIETTGYDGTMGEKGWAILHGLIAPRYGVEKAGDLLVRRDTTVDRGITVDPGYGWCYGVADQVTTNWASACDPQPSGTRYDLVVKRTDWTPLGGGPTQFYIIKGGPTTALPIFENRPGVKADQPLALVPVIAGQTQVGNIIDLRCWAGPGGYQIADGIALQYLGYPAVTVNLGNSRWTYELQGNGVWGWKSAWDEYTEPVRPTLWGNGWNSYSGSGFDGVFVQIIDGVVYGNGAAVLDKANPFSTAKAMFKLPAQFWPSTSQRGSNCSIARDGNVYPGKDLDGQGISFSFTYPLSNAGEV